MLAAWTVPSTSIWYAVPCSTRFDCIYDFSPSSVPVRWTSKTNKGILYIAGTGPELDEINKIIKENKIENRIKLLGFLNKDEMREVTRKARFIVIPSIWYENCPYSAIETQAIGKPIIGANIGGIPELVKDKENGLIYKYDDVNELTEKLNLLFENDKLVREYSKNAKEYAKKEYSTESYYKKLISIYNKVKEQK